MKKCLSCEKDIKLKELYCSPCIKEIRNIVKDVEDFKSHTCPGHGPMKRKNIKINGFGGFINNISVYVPHKVIFKCNLCAREVENEYARRIRKSEKLRKLNLKIENQKKETLVSKCCLVIARDPGLILAATNTEVPEHLWKIIYNFIPNSNDGKFRQICKESEKGEEWKYAAVGSVFKRFKGKE